MIKRNRYFRVVVIALLSLGAVACKQEREPCLSLKTALLNVRTLHYTALSGTKAVDTAIPNPIWVAMTDTVDVATIYTQRDSFNLTLSSVSAAGTDKCITHWAFTTDSFKHDFDTLGFYYRRLGHFISNACGYMYFYDLDSVRTTHHNIDSIVIVNPSVTTNVNTRHLSIYIHPNF